MNSRCFVVLNVTRADYICYSAILTKARRDALLSEITSEKTRVNTFADNATPKWDEVTVIITDDFEDGDMLFYEMRHNEITM